MKAAGCAVTGIPDDINPLNMVSMTKLSVLNLDTYKKMDNHFIPIESTNFKNCYFYFWR